MQGINKMGHADIGNESAMSWCAVYRVLLLLSQSYWTMITI